MRRPWGKVVATSYEDKEVCVCVSCQDPPFFSQINSSLLLEINIPIRSFLVFTHQKMRLMEKCWEKRLSIHILVREQTKPPIMSLRKLWLVQDLLRLLPYMFFFSCFCFFFVSGCVNLDPNEVTRGKPSFCFPGCCQRPPWIYVFPRASFSFQGEKKCCFSGCKVFS